MTTLKQTLERNEADGSTVDKTDRASGAKLNSPVIKGVQNHMVLARFCLLFAGAKSRSRVRGRIAPGLSMRSGCPAAPRGRHYPKRQIYHNI